MFENPCDLAKYVEVLGSNILDLERSSKVWKVRETSITDLIIASFKANITPAWLEVDASHEATTNADFEVIFRSGGKDLTFLIQAKRTGATKKGAATIPELFHPKSSGLQNRSLIDFAKNNNMIALYSVFLSTKQVSNLTSHIYPFSGIMIQPAIEVRNNGYRHPKKNVLLASNILKKSVPFHRLFCAASSKRTLVSVAQTLVSEDSGLDEEEISARITPSISFQERRERDRDQRLYRDAADRSFDTFRVLIKIEGIDPQL